MLEAAKIALQLLTRVDLKGSEAEAYVYTVTTLKNYVEENSPSGEDDADDQ